MRVNFKINKSDRRIRLDIKLEILKTPCIRQTYNIDGWTYMLREGDILTSIGIVPTLKYKVSFRNSRVLGDYVKLDMIGQSLDFIMEGERCL